MKYVFVGITPRQLASGRPLVFGDVVDESDLTPEDQPLTDELRPIGDEPTVTLELSVTPVPEAPGPSTSTPEVT